MEIYVACDVCGHRYVLPPTRQGRVAKCKSCGVTFDVTTDNYYDPETSESDDPVEDDDDSSSSLSTAWDLAKTVMHGVAGLVTFGVLLWMASLLFQSPQQAAADMAASRSVASKLRNKRMSPELVQPSRPSIPQPNVNIPQPHAPFVPPQPPFSPPQFKPANRNLTSPPVSDGSVGWPKDEGPTASPSPAPTNPTPSAQPNSRNRNTDLTVGQMIQVEKDGDWLDAIVRKLERDGMIRVHYRGRSQGDDESVPRERIRKK
jgi:hypothetical protein